MTAPPKHLSFLSRFDFEPDLTFVTDVNAVLRDFFEAFLEFEIAICRWINTGKDIGNVDRASAGQRFERLCEEGATTLKKNQRARLLKWKPTAHRIFDLRNAMVHGKIGAGVIDDTPLLIFHTVANIAADKADYVTVQHTEFIKLTSVMRGWQGNLEHWLSQREQHLPKPAAATGP